MARSLFNARVLVASFTRGLSLAILRRGYSGAPRAGRLGVAGSRSGFAGKVEERGPRKEEAEASSAWAPDPVTGYYRPGNHAQEIDPVELREMLLNNKVKSN